MPVLCLERYQLHVDNSVLRCRNKFRPRSSKVCFGYRFRLLFADQRDAELQAQYSNYKETLQAIAQKIGDVETEAEEHKYVCYILLTLLASYLRKYGEFAERSLHFHATNTEKDLC